MRIRNLLFAGLLALAPYGAYAQDNTCPGDTLATVQDKVKASGSEMHSLSGSLKDAAIAAYRDLSKDDEPLDDAELDVVGEDTGILVFFNKGCMEGVSKPMPSAEIARLLAIYNKGA